MFLLGNLPLILIFSILLSCERKKPEIRHFNEYIIEIQAVDDQDRSISLEIDNNGTKNSKANKMHIKVETSDSFERELKPSPETQDNSITAQNREGIYGIILPEEVNRTHIETLYLSLKGYQPQTIDFQSHPIEEFQPLERVHGGLCSQGDLYWRHQFGEYVFASVWKKLFPVAVAADCTSKFRVRDRIKVIFALEGS